MAANNLPTFTKAANATIGGIVTAANTKSDGSGTVGTSIFLIATAGANGSLLEAVQWVATATAAATSTTATVGRIFMGSVLSGTLTSANTVCIGEVTLPSVSADSSSTPVPPIFWPCGRKIPANYGIFVTNHAAPAASTAWVAVPWIGDY